MTASGVFNSYTIARAPACTCVLLTLCSSSHKGMRAPKVKWLNYLLVLTLFNVTLHLCYVYFLLQVGSAITLIKQLKMGNIGQKCPTSLQQYVFYFGQAVFGDGFPNAMVLSFPLFGLVSPSYG